MTEIDWFSRDEIDMWLTQAFAEIGAPCPTCYREPKSKKQAGQQQQQQQQPQQDDPHSPTLAWIVEGSKGLSATNPSSFLNSYSHSILPAKLKSISLSNTLATIPNNSNNSSNVTLSCTPSAFAKSNPQSASSNTDSGGGRKGKEGNAQRNRKRHKILAQKYSDLTASRDAECIPTAPFPVKYSSSALSDPTARSNENRRLAYAYDLLCIEWYEKHLALYSSEPSK